MLWGIALKRASVFTVVFALGATAWPAVVLVLLLAPVFVLPLVCARAVPLAAAKTAAAISVICFLIIKMSPLKLTF